MKRLMISTALATLIGTAAMAQDSMFRAESDPLELHASEFIGKRVYASEAAVDGDAFDGIQDGWEDIGEINDVVLTRDGKVEAVLVDIGGFLGIGERQVAVDMDAVRFVADNATADDEADYFLVINAARATLEGAPEYSWTDAPMTGDGEATDQAAAAADTATEAAGETAAEASDASAAATGTTADATAEAMTREPISRDGYAALAAADLTTEMLTGAAAYDANDEWIGELSELIVDEQGKLTDAVIDVGGFLGIGEKPVKLAMNEVDILRKGEGGEVRVYVPMTREQLEALPTYDK